MVGVSGRSGRGYRALDFTVIVVATVFVVLLTGGAGFLLRDFGRQVLTRDVGTIAGHLQSGQDAELDRLRSDLKRLTAETDATLTAVKASQGELDRLIHQSRVALDRDLNERQGLESELARLRAETTPTAASANGQSPPAPATLARMERGNETLAELYGRLARLEASVAALTNPILLPGEPYQVPAEFLPEALRWENWKDVGEAAFALGDYANRSRIHLDRSIATTVGQGITQVRVALTRSVYPNLGPAPSADQRKVLRAGLGELATTFAALRETLETRYQAADTDDHDRHMVVRR